VADAPWRCSACGTINEPAANACQACGRWPSLFDLEASTIEVADVTPLPEPAFERRTFEREPVDMRGEIPVEPDEPIGDAELEEAPQAPTWRRVLTSAIIPIAFVIYLLISFFFSDPG
jgi:predicted ATP-dependent serine protease